MHMWPSATPFARRFAHPALMRVALHVPFVGVPFFTFASTTHAPWHCEGSEHDVPTSGVVSAHTVVHPKPPQTHWPLAAAQAASSQRPSTAGRASTSALSRHRIFGLSVDAGASEAEVVTGTGSSPAVDEGAAAPRSTSGVEAEGGVGVGVRAPGPPHAAVTATAIAANAANAANTNRRRGSMARG